MAEDEKTKDEAPKASAKKEKVADGDMITVEYDTWIINQDGSEDLFDTTNEELAKEKEIWDEKNKYIPLNTIVGAGRNQGLDASFGKATVGEKQVVEIPPEDGAGDWDATKVEIHSIREFEKQKIDPIPGIRVSFKNKVGTIITATSGRVRIDFNEPLAGKTVRYEYTVIGKAKNDEERALAIIAMDYGDSEGFEVKAGGDVLEITLPEICKYDQNWFVMKYRVVGDLREHMEFKAIRFVEDYTKKEEEPEAAEEASDAPEESPPEEQAPEEKKTEEPDVEEATSEKSSDDAPVEETPAEETSDGGKPAEETSDGEEPAEEEPAEEEREKEPEEL